MTEIEVRNQTELDAALERQDVKDRDALIVVCGDGRFVIRSGAPTMEARDSSKPTMEAWDSSQPTMVAWDSSQPRMVARGSSKPTMEAWGSSQPTMVAWDSSQPRMVAWGSSKPTMEAWDSSQPTMVAWDSSQPTMVAWGSSKPRMVARGSSKPTMEAWDSSQPTMVAWDSSQPRMVARGSSKPTMEAWGSSQLHRSEPEHLARGFRADYWSILDQAPGEVDFLRKAMVAGEINGSVYCDDSGCGCLSGTLGIAHSPDDPNEGTVADALTEMGIEQNAGRPAEQWFIRIQKGDKPLPADTKEWPSDSVLRISLALAWLDEWVESRTAIAKALGLTKKSRAKKKAAK